MAGMDDDDTQNADKLAIVDYYVRLVLKRRWLVLIPFFLAMLGGIAYSLKTPETYSATNLIIVVPKSVPDKYVQALQTTDMSQRINTIKQQIVSRSNLEKIIKDFELFTEEKYRDMYEEDKIAMMRDNISVNVTKAKGGGVESFKITYSGKDPKKVRDVVNTLADSFILKSIEVMQEEALETNKFLMGELNEIKQDLEQLERSIEQYRKEHMGELPEELPSNLKLIERFQLQLNDSQQNIRDARNRIADLDNLIAASKLNASAEAAATSRASDLAASTGLGQALEKAMNRPPSELEQLGKMLADMQIRYTEMHPDVIRIKAKIASLQEAALKKDSAALEDAVADLPAENGDGTGSVSTDIPSALNTGTGNAVTPVTEGLKPSEPATPKPQVMDSVPAEGLSPAPDSGEIRTAAPEPDGGKKTESAKPQQMIDPALLDLLNKRQAAEREIRQYSDNIAKLEKMIDAYQKHVENTPKVELGLTSLLRNYDNIQRNYKNLLDRKLESDIALNLEKKQKGEKFEAIDRAKLPQKPVSPNMKKIFGICIVLSLGMGGGLIFLLDFLDTSLRKPEMVEPLLEIPVIGTIPIIFDRKMRILHRLNQIMTLFFVMINFVLFLAMGILTAKGVGRTMAYVKKLI